MSGSFRLTIFVALCILACALAARPQSSQYSQSSYSKVHRRKVPTSSQRIGVAQPATQKHATFSGKSSAAADIASASSTSNNVATTTTPEKSQTGNLLKVAKAIARSHSTSEVLTLNLTNLLILIVLKAIIFGIGLFYFGGVSFKGHGGGNGWSSRSLGSKSSSSSIMTEGELMLMLTYLLGASNDNYECMYRVACEDPSKAKEYLNVSKMILKGAKFMKKYVPYNAKYENVVFGLQNAVEHKIKGGDCSAKYVCSDVPNL